MNKMYIALAILAIFGIANVLPQDALAQPAPTQPFNTLRMEWKQDAAERKEVREENRAERREDWRENRAERHAQMRERLATGTEGARARFTGDTKKAVVERLDNMFNRFTNALDRLASTEARIEAHIDARENSGADVTDARAALEAARDMIATANTVVADTEAVIREDVQQEEEITRDGLQDLVRDAKEAVQAAHRALLDIIPLLYAANE